MRVKELTISNFLSFGEKQTIQINTNINLVQGIIDEQKDKSNGAGKSTIIEAIYWCLTGESLRNISASNVINKEADYCEVLISFEIKGVTHIIQRYYSPNKKSLFVDSQSFHTQKEGSEYILKYVLGMTKEDLSSSIYFGEFAKSFISLPDSEKSAFLARFIDESELDILDNDLTEDYTNLQTNYKTLNDKVLKNTTLLQSYTDTKNTKNLKIKEKEENLKSLVPPDTEEVSKEERIEAKEKQDKAGDIYQEAESKRKVEKELTSLRNTLKDVTNNISKKQEERLTLLTTKTSKSTQLKGLEKDKEAKLEKLKLLEEHKDKCDRCNQDINSEKHQELVEKDRGIIEDISNKIISLQEELSSYEKKEISIDNFIKEEKKKLQNLEKEVEEKEEAKKKEYEEVKKLYNVWVEASKVVKDLFERSEIWSTYRKEQQSIQSVITTLKQDVTEAEQQIISTNSNLQTLQKDIKIVEKKIETNEIMTKKLKSYRFEQFDKLLSLFNGYLEHYRRELSLDVSSIRLDSKKELSNKKEKSTINLQILRGTHLVDIGGLSQGERMRVSLILFLTIRKMINTLTGCKVDLICLDEPLVGLDKAAKEALYEIITSLGETEQVLLIDHDSTYTDRVSSIIQVEKINGVSYIKS